MRVRCSFSSSAIRGPARATSSTVGQQGGPDTDGDSRAEQPEASRFPGWVEVFSTVVATLFLAAVLAWFGWVALGGWRRRRRSRRRPPPATQPEHVVHAAFLDEAQRELSLAADRQIEALRSGEPRNAIVACWVALEDAVARVGLPRDPAETSTEFTRRIVQAVTVDSRAATDLAALYREARFSAHPLLEAHRDTAIALLTALSEELRRARPMSAAATTLAATRAAPEDT